MTHTQTQGADGAEKSFQERVVGNFRHVCNEAGDPTDLPERRDRFGEEAMEIFQALDGTQEEARQIVDYVFGREKGQPRKEIGQGLVTLTALATHAGHDLMACGEEELARLWQPEVIEKIRRKRAARHGRGPLPGVDAALASSTPAPAATPGVPVGVVKALSDIHFHMYDCDAGFAKVPRQRLAEWKALIAAQPAGQAGDAGAEETCAWAGGNDTCYCRTCGEEYRYGREDKPPCPRKPAPNSTRTGAADTERKPDELTETEIRGRAAALISAKGWKPGETLHFKAVLDLMTEHGMAVASNPPQDRCAHPACGCDADSVCGAALAARPEAPSDAGWSFDMKAAPQDGTRILLWMHGCWIHPVIGYRAPSAPGSQRDCWREHGSRARIHRADCWRLIPAGPTPPSDPAPSGQAEG